MSGEWNGCKRYAKTLEILESIKAGGHEADEEILAPSAIINMGVDSNGGAAFGSKSAWSNRFSPPLELSTTGL
jgi:hypothetical protein